MAIIWVRVREQVGKVKTGRGRTGDPPAVALRCGVDGLNARARSCVNNNGRSAGSCSSRWRQSW